MSNELQKAAENASFQMWQAYCDKKMECEDLQEQVEAQAARIAELEAQVNDLLALCTQEDHELRERVKQAARRAQVVPKGWKLVPEEPTQAMYDRVMREGYYHDDPKAVKAVLRAEYQDMLAAAPQPPEAACNPSVQPFIESRDVVSTGSGITVTRCNLSEAGREALQSKADHIPNTGKMAAAPVQLPESISNVLEDCRSRAIDYATCPSPYNNTSMETAFQSLEHQVRQLLAAHNIKPKP